MPIYVKEGSVLIAIDLTKMVIKKYELSLFVYNCNVYLDIGGIRISMRSEGLWITFFKYIFS